MMDIALAILVATILYSPLIAFSLLRSKAIKQKEKPWQYLVRASLPPLTFLILNLVLFILEENIEIRRTPITEGLMLQFIATLIAAGVFLLMCIDNIRCQSKINKVLGVLFLINGVVIFPLYFLSQ